MIYFPRDTSTEDIVQLILEWIELWADLGSESALSAITVENDAWTVELLDLAVSSYHSSELYPDTRNFTVTPPSLASVAKHLPFKQTDWYDSPDTALAGSISLDLPLNGYWSGLQADFDIWKGDDATDDYLLTLSEIRDWEQHWSEEERLISGGIIT